MMETLYDMSALAILIWHLHHLDTERKKLNKTVLFSASSYIQGVQWADNIQYTIPGDD